MKTRHKPEQIIHKLRQAEILLGQGKRTEEVCRDLGISDATYYKWRRKYGGLEVNQAKKMKQLEVENARLKRVVADLTLDKQILQEVVEGKL